MPSKRYASSQGDVDVPETGMEEASPTNIPLHPCNSKFLSTTPSSGRDCFNEPARCAEIEAFWMISSITTGSNVPSLM